MEKDETTAPIESGGPPKKFFKDSIPPVVPTLPFPSHFSKTKKKKMRRKNGYFSKSPSQHSSS